MSTFPHPHTHDPTTSNDFIFADEVVPQNSPLIRPIKVNFRPSPTPSLELSSSDLSPQSARSPHPEKRGRKTPRGSNKANLGDAVLVSYMGDGTRRDIAIHAGQAPLAAGLVEDDTSLSEDSVSGDLPDDVVGDHDEETDRGSGSRANKHDEPKSDSRRSMSIDAAPSADSEAEAEAETGARAGTALQLSLLGDLQSLATTALAFGGHRAEISDNASRPPTSLDIKRDRERAPTPAPLSLPASGPAPAPIIASRPSLLGDGVAETGRREGPLTDRDTNREREYVMERDQKPLPLHPSSLSPYSPQSSSTYAHHSMSSSLSPLTSSSLRSPTAIPRSELAPIHMQAMASPRSETNGSHHNALPSIRDLDLTAHSPDGRQSLSLYAHSPPASLHRLSVMSHHGSPPPMSPNDAFRRDLPSPAMHLSPQASSPYYAHHPPAPSHVNGYHLLNNHNHHSRHSIDYSSSSATETPGSTGTGDVVGGASPPGALLSPSAVGGPVDHHHHPQPRTMSIDGLTTTMGAYVCTFPGCTALPFQTQYLLNSHANVHSSERPHYCPVKGCPRSEGGKGFKRKNEMIRHGLVHDSPGYVCPFCPDREHRYPRPDNLQRHVRVHHVDKDKDDPQLREVLAQRPDGPSRGRRRRHGAP